MKAVSQLRVTQDMSVNVSLELTVGEMDALLEATKDVTRWPMLRLRECLKQALGAARAAYYSDHFLE